MTIKLQALAIAKQTETTDSHFANYRFPLRFVPLRLVPFHFVPFRFANYSKPIETWSQFVNKKHIIDEQV